MLRRVGIACCLGFWADLLQCWWMGFVIFRRWAVRGSAGGPSAARGVADTGVDARSREVALAAMTAQGDRKAAALERKEATRCPPVARAPSGIGASHVLVKYTASPAVRPSSVGRLVESFWSCFFALSRKINGTILAIFRSNRSITFSNSFARQTSLRRTDVRKRRLSLTFGGKLCSRPSQPTRAERETAPPNASPYDAFSNRRQQRTGNNRTAYRPGRPGSPVRTDLSQEAGSSTQEIDNIETPRTRLTLLEFSLTVQ